MRSSLFGWWRGDGGEGDRVAEGGEGPVVEGDLSDRYIFPYKAIVEMLGRGRNTMKTLWQTETY
jgi:hypothetical protein